MRGKFLAGLKRLRRRKKLQCVGPAAALADRQQFAKLLRRLHRHDWVVYAKPAFGRSNPIAHRLRRKRQRLPPSLLIENASDRVPLRSESVLPEAFPIKPSDYSPEIVCRLHVGEDS